ncbi:MAG TPA: FAD-linked oxidase C-terminal domain-containing protein, partial [Terriglobales bacterium]|nr:FAD-linked oxidase C-terminal domain-containing protein [Terriglobales bacterium]
KGRADLVVLPRSRDEVCEIARLASEARVAIVPRGAGTGLSGGSVPRQGGIVLVFSRMTKILEIDAANRRAVVEPGVVNLELSQAAAKYRLYFAPDPSSQKASTLGGNVAENSGGPHTLAYGVTVNHVTGLEVVLASGRVIEMGGKAAESLGYDLTGFFVGSEGTLGIVTRITVKLSPLPELVATLLAIFNTIDDAANTVTSLTAEGITPSALEMLDGWTLRTVEEATHAGYPMDSGAVLLIELEGLREEVAEQAEAVAAVCNRNRAREVRRAKNDRERQLLWMGRKNAFASIGRLSPSYYTQDGVVPRTRIPEVLKFIEGVSQKYGLRIGNIFHAGDGNLHPAILFDIRDPEQVAKTHAAGADILRRCVEMGGAITGEHGVGMEKNELMSMMFSEEDLEVMKRLHDAFNPDGVLNPQKLFPTPRSCREGIVSRQPLPEAPR